MNCPECRTFMHEREKPLKVDANQPDGKIMLKLTHRHECMNCGVLVLEHRVFKLVTADPRTYTVE